MKLFNKSLTKNSTLASLGIVASLVSAQALAVLPASGLATTDLNPTAMPTANTQLNTRILASAVATDAQGQEVLSPITNQTQLTSGNVIEYRGYVVNNSPERIRNATVTLDIPANTELLSTETLSPNRAKGSIDGVNFQYLPLRTNVGGVMQPVATHFYKAVQWDIEGLGLNEVATVKYRVRVK
ncbi:hypothetical protein ACGTJS_05200 [Faucicola mancuniensis]|uniref:hypothetical protein n=1 Tax=Faucicola mancuniensis TaxID=1309795 RepID=UPI0039778F1A